MRISEVDKNGQKFLGIGQKGANTQFIDIQQLFKYKKCPYIPNTVTVID